MMIYFKKALESRLEALEDMADQGVIPGQMDSIELQQVIGRIKELKIVLRLLGDAQVIETPTQKNSKE